jgi:hypothetical protein
MDTIYKDILVFWGAALSTLLGAAQLVKYYKDKPRISVDADLIFNACGENDEVKGTKIDLGEKGWNEILLWIKVVNAGAKAIQISAVLIEDGQSGSLTQITGDKLPAVLEPLTSIDFDIQKEWIDKRELAFFGVIDALGKRYSVTQKKLSELIAKTNSLPSNKMKYKRKDDPSVVVEAFKIKDKATFINKPNRLLK